MLRGASGYVFAVSLALGACADSDHDECRGTEATASALIGGEVEAPAELAAQLEAVVVLGRGPSRGPMPSEEELCSGVLIGRDYVMTSRSCAQLLGDGARVWLGGELSSAVVELGVESFETNSGGALAVGRLDAPASAADVPTTIDVGFSLPELGDSVTLVGFGAAQEGAHGTRRFRTAEVTALTDTAIEVDAGEPGGPCPGDSGGPLLVLDVDGRATVAGVLSRADGACPRTADYARVDLEEDLLEEADAVPRPDTGC